MTEAVRTVRAVRSEQETPSRSERTDAPGGVLGAAGRGVLRGLRAVRWYFRTLMGDSAYGTYLAHQRATHPDEEPLTERQFWRQRMDDQDRNPGARCC